MKNLYHGFKMDLFFIPLATLIIFACLILPLSLPLILILPLVIIFIVYKRTQKGIKILKEEKGFHTSEVNYFFDNPILAAYICFFIIPICIFNYFYVLGANDLTQNLVRFALDQNSYFLDLIYKYEILKPILPEEIYKLAANPIYKSVLYPFAVTFLISILSALSIIFICPDIIKIWIKRQHLPRNIQSQRGLEVIGIAAFAVVLAALLFGYFYSFTLGFFEFNPGDYRYIDQKFYRLLQMHSFAPFLLLYLAFAVLGRIIHLQTLLGERND